MSDEDFVVAYMTCETAKEVADATGYTAANVHWRSKRLRQAGVNLPKLKDARGRQKKDTDVIGLNDLVKKYAKQRKANR